MLPTLIQHLINFVLALIHSVEKNNLVKNTILISYTWYVSNQSHWAQKSKEIYKPAAEWIARDHGLIVEGKCLTIILQATVIMHSDY